MNLTALRIIDLKKINTVRYLKDSLKTRSYLLKFVTKIVCENITQTQNSLRNDFVHYSRPDQEFV